MNRFEIKEELRDNWEQFASNQDPYDLLNEFADSAVPAYDGDVITAWRQMPFEFDNYWQEHYESVGVPENLGIVDLMRIDLWNYANHLFTIAYNELCLEAELKESAE